MSEAWKSVVVNGKLWKKIHKRNVMPFIYYLSWKPRLTYSLFIQQVVLYPDWKKMYQTLVERKSSARKPDDDAALEKHHDWHRSLCLLVHKTTKVSSSFLVYSKSKIHVDFGKFWYRLWNKTGQLEKDSKGLLLLMYLISRILQLWLQQLLFQND